MTQRRCSGFWSMKTKANRRKRRPAGSINSQQVSKTVAESITRVIPGAERPAAGGGVRAKEYWKLSTASAEGGNQNKTC